MIDILKDLSEISSKSVLSETSLKELQGLSFEQTIHQLLIKNLSAHQKPENLAMLLALESQYLLNKEKFPNFQDFLYIDWKIIRKLIDQYYLFQNIPEKELKSRISDTMFFIDTLIHRYLLFDSPYENDQQFLDFLTQLALSFLTSTKK
nr:hypothetical protein [Candidatus Prometheoarchaeum syntrophicum]